MRRLKLILMWTALIALVGCIAYAGHLVRLTYAGYCHAAEKYLTDDEKIRVALVDLLKKHPPVVMRSSVEANVFNMSPPDNPILYRNVDDFLSRNPDCCSVRYHTFPAPEMQPDVMPPLSDILTGTATRVVIVTYLVRFKDERNVEQSVKTTTYLHINNCGAPAKPWSLW